MLNLFRSFMHSKIGVVIALGFLALIALAFAAGDVAGMRSSGGGDADGVASVGNRSVTAIELGQAATSAVEQVKRDNPTMTMKAFIAGGGLSEVLDQTVDRAALAVFGEQHGVIASDRLIDSEIAKIPAFQGPDGKFSDAAYKGLLQQRGLTDVTVRRDLGDGLIARQLLTPAALGAKAPAPLVARYVSLLAERRSGAIALLPAVAFAPRAAPGDAEISTFYGTNRNRYIRPERRTIRFVVFDGSALKDVPAPTDAEIAARYTANKAAYGPSENRKVSQLVLPTEAAAKAVVAEVAGGKSLEASAAAKGLAVAALGPVSQSALATQTTQSIAAAAFATAKGKLAAPVRGLLGWTVVRVDAIESNPGKTLDQASAEITADLTKTKRIAALADFSARIEEQFDNGSSLGDVAKELGLPINETPQLTANGEVYGAAGQQAPAQLARVLPTAFSMEREGQPQLADLGESKTFLVFDVSRIIPSAPAPLGEIKAQVAADLLLQKGAAAAKAAAERILAQTRKGSDLSAAMAALGNGQLPPVDRVDLGREQLSQQGQAVPPPLSLLFSMAQSTTKLLAAPNNRGWYVVSLAKIVPGDAAKYASVLPVAARSISEAMGREYAEQLRAAIRLDVGVKRNQPGIDAVARRLTGAN